MSRANEDHALEELMPKREGLEYVPTEDVPNAALSLNCTTRRIQRMLQRGYVLKGTKTSTPNPSRHEALRVERFDTLGVLADKAIARSAGRDGRSPDLGVIVSSYSTQRAPFSGHEPTDRGLLTHLLVAIHVPLLQAGSTPEALLTPMSAMADLLIVGNRNRTAALRAGAVSLANRYFTRLAPASPEWRLLGVEYDTGRGQVDLAGEHAEYGAVIFDEIKTSQNVRWAPPDWLHQITRYNLGGETLFGDVFLGVRLLPLAKMELAKFYPQAGGEESYHLDPTPADPLRPAMDESGVVVTESRAW